MTPRIVSIEGVKTPSNVLSPPAGSFGGLTTESSFPLVIGGSFTFRAMHAASLREAKIGFLFDSFLH